MYNTIISVGHLTKDPESRQTSTGKTICQMRVCISESNAKNKCFIDVEAWEKTAEACIKYLAKGREVLVDGELCCSSWTDKSGNVQSKNYIRANKVKFLGSPPKSDNGDGPVESKQTVNRSSSPASNPDSYSSPEEDDIPF